MRRDQVSNSGRPRQRQEYHKTKEEFNLSNLLNWIE
jgi:hypothetical protein